MTSAAVAASCATAAASSAVARNDRLVTMSCAPPSCLLMLFLKIMVMRYACSAAGPGIPGRLGGGGVDDRGD